MSKFSWRDFVAVVLITGLLLVVSDDWTMTVPKMTIYHWSAIAVIAFLLIYPQLDMLRYRFKGKK